MKSPLQEYPLMTFWVYLEKLSNHLRSLLKLMIIQKDFRQFSSCGDIFWIGIDRFLIILDRLFLFSPLQIKIPLMDH